jgi:predicted metal-dependent HD superfamily phosphohydrolase
MTSNPIPQAHLEAEWLQLAAELAVDQTQARSAYDDVVRRYAQSHRVYHTLQHVAQVLRDVQRLSPAAPAPASLRLAAWLHDVVYQPPHSDDEARSAAYAAQLLQAWRQPHALVAEVQRLILLTQRHQTAPRDNDGRILLDADLAILGAVPAAYARYAAAIRREYARLPEEEYRAGRVAVLRRFLQRPFIYHTALMRREREDAARKNLRTEIEQLS